MRGYEVSYLLAVVLLILTTATVYLVIRNSVKIHRLGLRLPQGRIPSYVQSLMCECPPYSVLTINFGESGKFIQLMHGIESHETSVLGINVPINNATTPYIDKVEDVLSREGISFDKGIIKSAQYETAHIVVVELEMDAGIRIATMLLNESFSWPAGAYVRIALDSSRSI
jgi:hypothetical protein